MTYGKYTLLDKQNPNIYAYKRELARKKILILLNFSYKNAVVNIEINTSKAKVIMDNYSITSLKSKVKSQFILCPYEALIYEL